jgi:murein DD-endopeptidase MepM/ murein hydrolase activator NlpD
MIRRLRTGKVTILLVPENRGASLSFKVSSLVLRLLVVAAVVLAFFFVVMLISWGTLYRKASIYDRLAEENAELLQEHNRVIELQKRVEQLTQLSDQIREALGATDQPSESDLRRPSAQLLNQANQPPASSFQAEPLDASSAQFPDRTSVYRFGGEEILKDQDVPSIWPVQGYVSRSFEPDEVIPAHSHNGIDLAAAEGTVIKATAGGVVVWSGWSPLYGNTIVLAHASGYFSMYGHCQVILAAIRSRVERGAPMALLGNTGQSSAPHLHFEIWHGNTPLDPADLLMPL